MRLTRTAGLPFALAAAVSMAASVFAPQVVAQVMAQALDQPDAPPPLTEADLARAINNDGPATARAPRATEGVVTEYRSRNRTYLIQVDPNTGSRYYVVDADGDGTPMEYRDNTESDPNISKWKIADW